MKHTRKQHMHSRSSVSDLLEQSADFSKPSEKQQEQQHGLHKALKVEKAASSCCAEPGEGMQRAILQVDACEARYKQMSSSRYKSQDFEVVMVIRKSRYLGRRVERHQKGSTVWRGFESNGTHTSNGELRGSSRVTGRW